MTPGKASYERGGFIPHPGMLLSHGMMPGPPHGSQVMGGSGKSFVPPSMHSQYSGRTGSCMMPSPMINDTGYARGEPGMRSPMMDVFKRSRVDPAASRRTSDVVGYSPTFASPNFGRSERRCYSEGGISYDGRSTSSDNVQLFSFNVEEQSPRLGRGSPPGPQEHNRNFKATPMMFSSDEQGFRSQQRSNQQYGEGPSMPEGEIGPGQDAQEYVPEKANEVAYFLDDMVTFPAEKVKPLNFTPLQTCADANSPHVPRRRGRPPVTSEKKITKDTPIPFSNGSVKQPVQNNTPYKSLNDIVEQDGLSLANNSQMFNPDLKVSTSNHSFEFRSDLSTSKDGFDKAGMEESLFNLDLPCVGDKNEYTHFGKDTTVNNKSEEISTMSPASTSSELGGFIDDRKVKLSRDAKDRLLAYLDVIMHELLTRTCEMVQGKNGGHLTLDDIKTVIVQHGKQGIKGVVPVHGLKYEVNAESQVDGTTAPVKRIDNDNIFKLLDGDQDKL
ncbi:hypothetical protein PAEPH01_1994 [Pancytospora epiphaga]|nr:hypothetical protein PAEPH01_1994 [Pancytospora epiphaga]